MTLRAHKDEKKTKLPLIVPVVFYQGRDPWWPEREFRELVEGALAEWRWVPRFEYLLVDQTLAEPEAVEGTPTARLTQMALMAAVHGGEELADRTARLVAEVSPEGKVEVWRCTWSTCWRHRRRKGGERSGPRCGATAAASPREEEGEPPADGGRA